MLETFLKLLAILWTTCSFSIMILMIIDWKNYKEDVLESLAKDALGQEALIMLITIVFAPVFMAAALAMHLKRK